MRTRRNNPSGKPKPDLKVLDLKELKDIIERAGSASLSDTDRAKLSNSVETLAWLQQELANQTITVARLRSLFGLNTSEKTKDVLPARDDDDGDDDGDDDDDDERDSGGGKNKKKKRRGHGRRRADQYVGAEQVDVPHGSLAPGDPCPSCVKPKTGRVYGLREPQVLVRVTGQPPLKATAYRLQTLRCNLLR